MRFVFGEGLHGAFVCFRIEIGPSPESAGTLTFGPTSEATVKSFDKFRVKPITTQTLRKIPVASLIEAHLWTLASSIRQGKRLTRADVPETSIRRLELELGRKAEKSAPSSRRPGRPPKYSPQHWQEVADVYLAHGGRAPRKAVAEHFDIALKKADKWIAEARRKGVLPRYGDTSD